MNYLYEVHKNGRKCLCPTDQPSVRPCTSSLKLLNGFLLLLTLGAHGENLLGAKFVLSLSVMYKCLHYMKLGTNFTKFLKKKKEDSQYKEFLDDAHHYSPELTVPLFQTVHCMFTFPENRQLIYTLLNFKLIYIFVRMKQRK
jgi:hypothetical protein